jgi:hypothetical protein
MRLFQLSVPIVILTGLLFLSPLTAQQSATRGNQATPPTSATMDMNKVMADMKASDARLEAMTSKMKMAQGDAKVMAMQDVVEELAKNQIEMHRHMMMHMTMGSTSR